MKEVQNILINVWLMKEMMPAFSISCSNMIEEWKEMAANQDTVEVDVWPELQRLSADIISRAAFGSNYEEGKKIFELLKQLTLLTLEAMQTLYLPGFRSNFCFIYFASLTIYSFLVF